jgi:hypothetical protein
MRDGEGVKNNKKRKAGVLMNAKWMKIVRALKLKNDKLAAISHRNECAEECKKK